MCAQAAVEVPAVAAAQEAAAAAEEASEKLLQAELVAAAVRVAEEAAAADAKADAAAAAERRPGAPTRGNEKGKGREQEAGGRGGWFARGLSKVGRSVPLLLLEYPFTYLPFQGPVRPRAFEGGTRWLGTPLG